MEPCPCLFKKEAKTSHKVGGACLQPPGALWVYMLIPQASTSVHFVPSPVSDLSSALGRVLRVSLANVGGTLGLCPAGPPCVGAWRRNDVLLATGMLVLWLHLGP